MGDPECVCVGGGGEQTGRCGVTDCCIGNEEMRQSVTA